MNLIDILSPLTIGEDKISITIDPSSQPLLVHRFITLNFDYSAALPSGLVKPLKLQVQPGFGDGTGYFEVLFDKFLPSSYAFQVTSAGQWLVVLRELGHNLWQGRILLDVGGDPYAPAVTVRY